MKKQLVNSLLVVGFVFLYLYLKYLVASRSVTAGPLALCQYELAFCGLWALVLSLCAIVRVKWAKSLLWLLSFGGTFVYLVDIATQWVLYNRVLWRLLFDFGKKADTFVGFILFYLWQKPGLLSLLIVALMVAFLSFNWHQSTTFKGVAHFFALGVLLAGLFLWDRLPLEEPRKVFNVYQINSSTDRISYKNFPMPADWAPTYLAKGQPRPPKNVILIFMESLSASYSQKTSGLNNLTPNLDDLAAAGLYFTNYFSNGYGSTDARFALLSGHPRINGNIYYDEPKFYDHSFIRYLKKHGYDTWHFAPAPDLQGSDKVYRGAQFAHRVLYDDPAYQGLPRYVFDSIDDINLLTHLAEVMVTRQAPFFAMAVTATTHSPYQVPDSGEYSLDGCISYADKALGILVKKLKERHYFDNGILVVTGDHHAMEALTEDERSRYPNLSANQRVPLVIVGAGIEPGQNDEVFDHCSLGPFIEYLALGTYETHQFQQDLFNPNSERLVLCQPNETLDIVDAYTTDSACYKIKLNGDKTVFKDQADLTQKYSEYLRYLAWLRQNF